MQRNSSTSTLSKLAARIEQKKAVYASSSDSTDVLALQDWYKSSKKGRGKVLCCKTSKGGYHVSQSPNSMKVGGLFQRWADRGGRAETRFAQRLGHAVDDIVKEFPHNDELKKAARSLNYMTKLNGGVLLPTAEFERCLDIVVAAKRMQNHIQAQTAAMCQAREKLRALSPDAFDAAQRAQGKDPERCIRNAEALNTVWHMALAQRLKAQDARASLSRFVQQQSQQAGRRPADFLEGLLLRQGVSYNLDAPVFKALLEQYKQFRIESVHQLTPRVIEHDKVDLVLLGKYLDQSLPTGKPIDWIGVRPAFMTVAQAEQHFALRLLEALKRIGDGPQHTDRTNKLMTKSMAVQAHCQNGVFRDTLEFRQAVSRLLKAQREAQWAATNEQEQLMQEAHQEAPVASTDADPELSDPLELLAAQLGDRYLNHLAVLSDMDAEQRVREFGRDAVERCEALAKQLNDEFSPRGADVSGVDVDAERLAGVLGVNSREAQIGVQRLLTETATPVFLHDSVFEALAMLSIGWELMAASDDST